MKSRVRILIAICPLAFIQSGIACERPGDVAIPDGRVATEKEMIDANAEIQNYVADMQGYQACLESEAQSERASSRTSDKEDAQQLEDKFSQRYSAASEAIIETAKQFEKSVEEYNARKL